jgi:hypothetical protein
MMAGGILGDRNHDAKIPERAFDWAAVDLRPGTPFGELFWVLLEFANELGALSAKPAGRHRLPTKQLQADYIVARKRWPKVTEVKSRAELMCKHSKKLFGGRYTTTPDTLRKRIMSLLELQRKVEESYRRRVEEWETMGLSRTDPLPTQDNPMVALQDPMVWALFITEAIKKALAARRRRGKN